MDAAASLSFASPWILWGLILLVPLSLWLHRNERRRRALANRFISERMRGRLMPARALRPVLLTMAAAALIVALAGPQFGATERSVDTPEAGLVILLDTSLSMRAADVGTSRVAAGRAVIQQVLDRFDGRAALVVFEGNAEVISPLTEDTVAVSTLVESVGAGELEVAGSNLRLAITAGLELLERAETPSAAMLLISDGEHRAEDLSDVLERARETSTPVVTVMIGSQEGTSIPTDEGEPLTSGGQLVVTRASEDILRSISRSSGGSFHANPFSEEAIADLAETVQERAFVSLSQSRVLVPTNRYQFPLSVAFVLLLLGSVVNRGSE